MDDIRRQAIADEYMAARRRFEIRASALEAARKWVAEHPAPDAAPRQRIPLPPEYADAAAGRQPAAALPQPRRGKRGKRPKPAADMLESELAQETKAAKVKPPRRRK